MVNPEKLRFLSKLRNSESTKDSGLDMARFNNSGERAFSSCPIISGRVYNIPCYTGSIQAVNMKSKIQLLSPHLSFSLLSRFLLRRSFLLLPLFSLPPPLHLQGCKSSFVLGSHPVLLVLVAVLLITAAPPSPPLPPSSPVPPSPDPLYR